MDKEKILELRKKWISQRFVQFEIAKALKGHELSFISTKGEEKKVAVRYMFARSIDYLNKHLAWINFDKRLLNMYMSVATLKDMPIFSYNMEKRLEDEKYKDFNKNYEKFVVGQDIFLDFDCKEDFSKGLAEVKEMVKILEEFKVPFWIMNSSFKGFHIHIPYQYLPENIDLRIIGEVLYNLKGVEDFTALDISINDSKRLCKVPYSCVGDGSVCLPLTNAMIDNFHSSFIEIENVLKNVPIKNRGLLLRDYGLDSSILKENVKKFLADYSEEFK
jgi:hypothetical protein